MEYMIQLLKDIAKASAPVSSRGRGIRKVTAIDDKACMFVTVEKKTMN
jgi:hypothetical protein